MKAARFSAAALVPLVRTLPSREREVLVRLGRCLSQKEIAADLNITIHTVRFHVRMIFIRLGIRSASEAALVAVAAKLVKP